MSRITAEPNEESAQEMYGPRPEIVEGLIRQGQIGTFGGAYGVGKSCLMDLTTDAYETADEKTIRTICKTALGRTYPFRGY